MNRFLFWRKGSLPVRQRWYTLMWSAPRAKDDMARPKYLVCGGSLDLLARTRSMVRISTLKINSCRDLSNCKRVGANNNAKLEEVEAERPQLKRCSQST